MFGLIGNYLYGTVYGRAVGRVQGARTFYHSKSFTSSLKDLQGDNVSIGSVNACKLLKDPRGPVPLPNSSAAFKVA